MSNEPSKKNMFGSWGMAKDKKAEAPTGDGAGGTTWLRRGGNRSSHTGPCPRDLRTPPVPATAHPRSSHV